jgi:hypothetical protein
MNIKELKANLTNHLLQGCRSHIKAIESESGIGLLGSYMFICYEGYDGFGIVCCEQEKLDASEKLDVNKWHLQAGTVDHFAAAAKYISEISDVFYDGEIEDEDAGDLDDYDDEQLWLYISSFYEDCIVSVFRLLKSEGFFKSTSFGGSVLLGVVMPDPDSNNKAAILRVSESLNSPELHQKVLASNGCYFQ